MKEKLNTAISLFGFLFGLLMLVAFVVIVATSSHISTENRVSLFYGLIIGFVSAWLIFTNWNTLHNKLFKQDGQQKQ